MKKNNLPPTWCVQNDGSQEFVDSVISYLNDTYHLKYSGYFHNDYYGVGESGISYCSHSKSTFGKNVRVLTINEFMDALKEDDENQFTVNLPEGKKVVFLEKTDDYILINLGNKKKSLKWEDVAKKRKGVGGYFVGNSSLIQHQGLVSNNIEKDANTVNSERQAQKVIALSQLMTIADAANEEIGWLPEDGRPGYTFVYDRGHNSVGIDSYSYYNYAPVMFKTFDLAKQVYEENKEIVDTFYKP